MNKIFKSKKNILIAVSLLLSVSALALSAVSIAKPAHRFPPVAPGMHCNERMPHGEDRHHHCEGPKCHKNEENNFPPEKEGEKHERKEKPEMNDRSEDSKKDFKPHSEDRKIG